MNRQGRNSRSELLAPFHVRGFRFPFPADLLTYPLTLGLQPFVATEVHHIGQTGLGTLISSFVFGALGGSLAIGFAGRSIRPGRMMIIYTCGWYAMLLAFVQAPGMVAARISLVFAGQAHSLSMTPMAVMLLHSAGARVRGKIMVSAYLLYMACPWPLLAAGAVIGGYGLVATASGYRVIEFGLTTAFGAHGRAALWHSDPSANTS